jgi:hypothetical protein
MIPEFTPWRINMDTTGAPPLDFTDATFIIPMRIESDDRETNARIVLSYLNRYLHTNVLILECGETPKLPALLGELALASLNIDYAFYQSTDPLPKTLLLNKLLAKVTTRVTVPYDIDVILPVASYEDAYKMITNGYDLVFPFGWGAYQCEILNSGRSRISETLDVRTLLSTDVAVMRSEYGHCQFFDTDSYRSGGMENENFVSYGPEDRERAHRFRALGYDVAWLKQHYVYHIKHSRGEDSSRGNPHFQKNWNLYENLRNMTAGQLREYYLTAEYLEQYPPATRAMPQAISPEFADS